MDRPIKEKNEFRLKGIDAFLKAPDFKLAQESEALLLQMAMSYLGFGPKLFEESGPLLNEQYPKQAEKRSAEDKPNSIVIIINERGNIESFDANAEQLFGYTANEVLGKNIEIIVNCMDKQKEHMPLDIEHLLTRGQCRRKDGSLCSIRLQISPFHVGERDFFVVLVHDVIDSADRLGKQQRMEKIFRNLIEQIPAVTFTASLDANGQELYVSPQIEVLLGFSPQEWLSDPIRWFHHIYPEDRNRMALEFARTCFSGTAFQGDFRVLTRDNCILWIHCEARMVRDEKGYPLFLHGVGFDITQTKTVEDKLRAALQEKEVLIKEIHHRVKNNLQITSSLLQLQASKIRDPQALSMFKESDERVRAIALVHEKLYQSRDLVRLDFGEYIKDLSAHLAKAYNLNKSRVNLRVDIAPVHLRIDQAVPCALIVNELVSNSIKHGFPSQKIGEILISFGSVEQNSEGSSPAAKQTIYELNVQDTGCGFPRGFDWKTVKTLGLQLVRNLTSQLGGTITFQNKSPGTNFSIIFPQ
jgi:PAS domain S-box-containing protein